MPQKWWVLTGVACGTFMATLDSSIVNIALPTLTKELSTDLGHIKWVVISYLLVITCLLLPFGRISDQHGRKRIFQLGFFLFTAGSALCGFSPSLGWLVLFRALQGLGAAMLMSNGPAIITAAFPASERGLALGTLAMVVSAGLISGPSVGGLLITHLGWRSIFLVNIPVGIAGLLVVRQFLPRDRRHPRVAFDWAGALLQMIVILGIIVLVEPPKISIADSGLFPIPRIFLAGLIFVFAAIFFKVESLAPAPILDMSLLQNRTFWTANLAGLLIAVAYSALTVLMPFYLEEVTHFGPDKAGLYMTAIPLMVFVIAPLSGRWSDRVGSRGLSGMGALVGAVGLFAMAGAFGEGLGASSSSIAIIIGLASMGLGTGLFQSPNNNAIMSAVPHQKLGVASALLATIRNLGLVLGTGLSMSMFSWRLHVTNDFVVSLHTTLLAAAFVGIGATIAAFGKPSGVHHFEFEDQKA